MNKKNILAISMAYLMLMTTIISCISVNAESNNNCVTESKNGKIRVELDFEETLKPKSCLINCDGMAGNTEEENGVQTYTYTGLSKGFHKIYFCSGPPYRAYMKIVYLGEDDYKTVTLTVIDLNQRPGIIYLLIAMIMDFFY